MVLITCACQISDKLLVQKLLSSQTNLLKRNQNNNLATVRAVFKWLLKVITWLQLLRLMIGLKDSCQFFSQWEAKPKPIAPRTRDFPTVWASFGSLLGIVIGSSRCLPLSFKNRSMLANYCLSLACITQGQDYRVTSSEVYDTRTKAMITAEN